MKYIKLFEDNFFINKKYYLIPFDDRYYSIIKELNLNEKDYEQMLYNKKSRNDAGWRPKYIWIGIEIDTLTGVASSEGYMPYKEIFNVDFFDKHGYKNCGTLGLTKEEIEEEELKWNVNKYNL